MLLNKYFTLSNTQTSLPLIKKLSNKIKKLKDIKIIKHLIKAEK